MAVAAALVAAILAGAACKGATDDITDCRAGPRVEPGVHHQRLSEYCFFRGALADHDPNLGVIPFAPASPLWSDGTQKDRFLYVPAGSTIAFDHTDPTDEAWDFPDGSVLIKTFAFADDARDPTGPRRNLETRLLIREGGAWTAHVYLWNDAQTDAVRFVPGTRLDVSYVDATGSATAHEYVVPDTNMCANCHSRFGDMVSLGLDSRQLNYVPAGATKTQFELFADQGVLSAPLPAAGAMNALVDPADTGAPLADRAKSWLYANCAHCHRPGGRAFSTGLILTDTETDPVNQGICKSPVAAGAGACGLDYDIVPGDPNQSILACRIDSVDPQVKMPELPNLLVDRAGVQLIRDWIAAMTPAGCPQP